MREPVDVGALARDAVDDARATAPEREIALDAPRGADGRSAIPTSCARCSPTCCATRSCTRRAGTPIEVAVCATATTCGSTVRDHGPGLPDGDADALFERFWRAEGGRERGRAGAGLGLAIVGAIVADHRAR